MLFRKRTEPEIISRFSSRVVRSALSTWKSQVFPNTVQTGAGDEARAAMQASALSGTPARRVLPKAQSLDLFSSGGSPKNSSSTGLEPGHPPSTYGIPKASSRRATSRLSAAEKETPSPWAPSRREVS